MLTLTKPVGGGQPDVEISSGTLELGVTYRGVPIYSETKDLCETAACPVKKGPYAVHVSEYFPPITPPVRAPLEL